MTATATSVIATIPHALHAHWATYRLPAGRRWRSLQALHLRWEPWNTEVSQIWISQSREVVSIMVTVTASDGPQSRPALLMLLNSNPRGYFSSTVHRAGFSMLACEVSCKLSKRILVREVILRGRNTIKMTRKKNREGEISLVCFLRQPGDSVLKELTQWTLENRI